MAQRTRQTTCKTYIDVAYKDRDLAKRLGARWDASVKRWYCPAGSTLALIYKWRKAPTIAAAPDTAPCLAANAPGLASALASAPAPAKTVRRVTRIVPPGTRSAQDLSQELLQEPLSLFSGENLELPLAS